MQGDARGVEVAWASNPAPEWKFDAAASGLSMAPHPDASSADPNAEPAEKNEPAYQIVVQTQFRPTPSLDLDATAYRIGERTTQAVPAYTALDPHVGGRPGETGAGELLLRNLLPARHLEGHRFASGAVPTE